MSNFTIETTRMSPGAVLDCKQIGCMPSVGGLCAHVPATTVWWCCPPYAEFCWSEPQQCDYNEDDSIVTGLIKCSAKETAWCCKSAYETCPPRGVTNQCVLRGVENPAGGGPIWGPDAVSGVSTGRTVASGGAVPIETLTFTVGVGEGTTPTPTPTQTAVQTQIQTQTALGEGGVGASVMPIAFSVAAVGVVAVIGTVVYLMWRRRRREIVPGDGPFLGPAGKGVGGREVAEIPAVYTQKIERSAEIYEI